MWVLGPKVGFSVRAASILISELAEDPGLVSSSHVIQVTTDSFLLQDYITQLPLWTMESFLPLMGPHPNFLCGAFWPFAHMGDKMLSRSE